MIWLENRVVSEARSLIVSIELVKESIILKEDIWKMLSKRAKDLFPE
jgi:hypothetical protein